MEQGKVRVVRARPIRRRALLPSSFVLYCSRRMHCRQRRRRRVLTSRVTAIVYRRAR
jgi:hypothetical protein